MSPLTDIQQAFVRQYMVDQRVLGVRVRPHQGDWALDVEVAEGETEALSLPDTYRGLPVLVRESELAVLAFAGH